MLCLLSATFLLAVAGNVRAQITPQNLSTVLEDIPVASRILVRKTVAQTDPVMWTEQSNFPA